MSLKSILAPDATGSKIKCYITVSQPGRFRQPRSKYPQSVKLWSSTQKS